MKAKEMGFDSKLIHSGDIHERFGSVVTPIYQTSTFSFRNAQHGADLFAGREKGYIYTCMGNPTIAGVSAKDKIAANITDGLVRYSVGIEDVEDLIADLEDALDKISI